jgi:hypothetical protein
MYGVIGEDTSDTETLRVLIRRITQDPKLIVKTKGYGGCGEMLTKGTKQIRSFQELGLTRFVVCYDADGDDPAERLEELMTRVIRPARCIASCCAVIPVQELEAWILADIEAVTNIFRYWIPRPISSPEQIQNPKEHLTRLSRAQNKKPIYDYVTHNEQVAKY